MAINPGLESLLCDECGSRAGTDFTDCVTHGFHFEMFKNLDTITPAPSPDTVEAFVECFHKGIESTGAERYKVLFGATFEVERRFPDKLCPEKRRQVRFSAALNFF